MSSLILSSPRVQQPQQALPVDRTNRFGRSLLVGGYPVGGSWWDAPQNRFVPFSTGSAVVGSDGFAHDLTNTAQAFTLDAKNTVTTNRITVWAIVNIDEITRADFVTVWTGGTANSQFNLLQGVAGNARPSFFISSGSSSASAAAGVGSVLVQDNTAHVCGTYDGSTIKVFINGILVGSTASSLTLNTSSLTSYRIANNGNGDGGYDGRVFAFGVHNEAFSEAAVNALSRNVWQNFQSLPKRVFFDLGAGGSAITINCTPGNAVANGTAAQINQAFSVDCTVGNAVAAGTAATINQAMSIACTVGDATAAGTTATINASINLSCTVGNAVAAGTTALIELGSGITIDCTPGNAVANGTTTTINEAFGLTCGVGNAVAAGVSATIDIILGTVARPISDVADGAWLPSTPAADLFAMIDEAAADDADYIYATSPTTCSLGLGSVSDPLASTGHVIKYRAWSPTTGGLVVRLKQGTTVIATYTHATLPTTPTTYTQTLTAGEADSITDYTALRVDFEATL